MVDSSLDWFLEDAKRQGLSLAEYERRYGIILAEGARPSPAAQRIRRHEISGGLMRDGDIAAAAEREERNRRGSTIPNRQSPDR